MTDWQPVDRVPSFGELLFRDCPWCRATLVQMIVLWNGTLRAAGGVLRGWVLVGGPRCAGLSALELRAVGVAWQEGAQFSPTTSVELVRQVPDDGQHLQRINHLPPRLRGTSTARWSSSQSASLTPQPCS
jgi:hypothetical protein